MQGGVKVYYKENPFQEVLDKETYVQEISSQTPWWSVVNLHKSDAINLEEYMLW